MLITRTPFLQELGGNVLIDCDGVISDFREAYVLACNKANGTKFETKDAAPGNAFAANLKLSKEQRDNTWAELRKPGHVSGMLVLPGARDGVRAISEVARVVFLTRLVSEGTWMAERTEWLKEFFGFVVPKKGNIEDHVVFATPVNKPTVPGLVYLDDDRDAVGHWSNRWGRFGGIGYYNKPYTPVAWEQVFRAVRTHVRPGHLYKPEEPHNRED